MKKVLLFSILCFCSICLSAQKYVKGKVRVVTSSADYKVRVVSAFADLKVQCVNSFPTNDGQWQMVDSFEDFSVQFVDAFEDFTIQYVDAFPGLTNSKTTPLNSSTGSSISKSKQQVYVDSFSIARLPGRKFPHHARVQVVDTMPDILVYAIPTWSILDFSTYISEDNIDDERAWLLVDSLPDFTIMFWNKREYCDIIIGVSNSCTTGDIRPIIKEYTDKAYSRYPDPIETPPVPNLIKREF